MKSDVPLGEWLPDAPSYKAPGLLDVRNAIRCRVYARSGRGGG
jgi:hypothetical protein